MHVNVSARTLFGTWIKRRRWINVIILFFWPFFVIKSQEETNVITNSNIKLITEHRITTFNRERARACACVFVHPSPLSISLWSTPSTQFQMSIFQSAQERKTIFTPSPRSSIISLPLPLAYPQFPLTRSSIIPSYPAWWRGHHGVLFFLSFFFFFLTITSYFLTLSMNFSKPILIISMQKTKLGSTVYNCEYWKNDFRLIHMTDLYDSTFILDSTKLRAHCKSD